VTAVPSLDDLWVVIPAGGSGTRLWPLSRAGAPKFLLDLTGSGRTLLQQTWDRLVPLSAAERILVVTGQRHAAAVAAQLPELGADRLLAEPDPRDSTAAIGLAAAVIATWRPDAVLGAFAADHVVREQAAFEKAVQQGVAAARQGYLTTIGIEPSHAATAFGYIRAGAALDVLGAPDACAVTAFVEKPDVETAIGYLAAGYRWNAGMWLCRAEVMLALLARYRPRLHEGLQEIAAAWRSRHRAEVLARVWPTLEKVAIDYAVAEPAAAAGEVAVVPADLGWTDIGDFASLAAMIGEAGTLRVLGDAASHPPPPPRGWWWRPAGAPWWCWAWRTSWWSTPRMSCWSPLASTRRM
jgi:mannose-1-phosphate guanylyltransferase